MGEGAPEEALRRRCVVLSRGDEEGDVLRGDEPGDTDERPESCIPNPHNTAPSMMYTDNYSISFYSSRGPTKGCVG